MAEIDTGDMTDERTMMKIYMAAYRNNRDSAIRCENARREFHDAERNRMRTEIIALLKRDQTATARADATARWLYSTLPEETRKLLRLGSTAYAEAQRAAPPTWVIEKNRAAAAAAAEAEAAAAAAAEAKAAAAVVVAAAAAATTALETALAALPLPLTLSKLLSAIKTAEDAAKAKLDEEEYKEYKLNVREVIAGLMPAPAPAPDEDEDEDNWEAAVDAMDAPDPVAPIVALYAEYVATNRK
jgi:hypothetical protein